MQDIEQYPPGLSRLVARRTPRRHRADVVQEAWLGYLMGRKASTVGRTYLAKEMLHELREGAFSQLTTIQHAQRRRREASASQPPRR